MADLEPPPPSYEDVISSPQPSAPPRGEVADPSPVPAPRPGYDPLGASLERERRTSANQPRAPPPSSFWDRVLEKYVSFSTPHLLRMNIEPANKHEDPELDVEAQFSRRAVRGQQRTIAKKRQLHCVSGWLWCVGVLLVLLCIALPVAMVVTGILGFDDCPFRSDTIIGYLIAGGCVLGAIVTIRILPSSLTICKNKNVFRTKQSSKCSGCICACETLFCLLFVLNIILLFAGSYWVFNERPPTECEPDCDDYCAKAVYVLSAFYVILQYALYVLFAFYLFLVLTCHRCLATKD